MSPPHKLDPAGPKMRGPHVKPDVRALPIRAFARAYGIHEVTVWRALKAGRLKSITIGRRRLVMLDSVGEPA